MQCDEIFVALVDYIDGKIDPRTAEAIHRHLEGCPVCELVVDNIRKTISVYCTHPAMEMPAEFEEHLSGLLRERFRAKFA